MYRKLCFLFIIVACSVAPQAPKTLGIGRTPDYNTLPPTSDYVFYNDEASLPSLFMTLNLTTHSKPSYLWFGRNTVDTNKLPKNITTITGSADQADAAMRVKIAEINLVEPNATFTLYLNDLRTAKASSFFYSQGINPDRVTVVSISDGSATYNEWVTSFGHANSFSKWLSDQSIYHSSKNNNLERDYFFTINRGVFLTVPSVERNTLMWLQWPELLSSDSTELSDYLQDNDQNYLKIDPTKYFHTLTQVQKNLFINLIGLDTKYTETDGSGSTLKNQTIKEAFDASPKPNIIITGTNPYGADTDRLIANVKKHYGDGFDYFFKGHPGDKTKPSDSSIIVLPFILPMEAIFFAYGDSINVLGGHQSSLYMSAPVTTQKFFFNTEANGVNLVPPLNIMFRDGLFGDPQIFN